MVVPPAPSFIYAIVTFILQYLTVVNNVLSQIVPPPPFPFGPLLDAIQDFLNIISRLYVPVHVIIRNHYDGNCWLIPHGQSIWNTLVASPENFWFVTGETPGSLTRVIERIGIEVEARVRDPWNPRRRLQVTRPYVLCLHDRILLTFMWLRQYYTITSLSELFHISPSNVYDTILTIVPIFYEHYAHRYVNWNSDNNWNDQRGEFDELPNAVGAIDAFAVQINRPQGAMQRLYYRRDRGYHFLNFHVIVDNDGFFQFSSGGYPGHGTDAASYARLPSIGYQRQLHLPRSAYLLADRGYPSVYPLVTPFRRPRRGRLNNIQVRANLEIDRARVRVEQRIGDARVYRSIPGRSGRFRGRRHFVPVVVGAVLSIVNRRRRLIRRLRIQFLAL